MVAAKSADGYGQEVEALLHAEGERDEVNLDLERRNLTLSGRVLHADGKPWVGTVAVAPIRGSFFEQAPWTVAPVATDGGGRFEVEGLPASNLLVHALQDNGTRVTGHPVRVPQQGEYRLVLEEETVELTGRVVSDLDGSPIAGAEIISTLAWSFGEFTCFRNSSGDQGRFRVRVPAASAALWVRAPGYCERYANLEGAKADVEVRLSKTARVWGFVTTVGDVRPTAGVRVTVSAVSEVKGRSVGADDPWAVTDSQGKYEVDGISPGTYVVFAHGDDSISSGLIEPNAPGKGPHRLAVLPGSETHLDLSMVRGARIAGRVIDADGRPVEGAQVLAFAPGVGRDDDLPWAAYISDRAWPATAADGTFEIRSLVPDITYQVETRPAGLPAASRSRVMAQIDRVRPIEIRLSRPRWVEVTVLTQGTEAPIAGAEVTVLVGATRDIGEADDGVHSSFSSDEAQGVTNAHGRARVGPVGQGEVSVSADAEGYPGARLSPVEGSESVVGDLTATVRLEPARSVKGRVLLPDGSPAVGASVRLTRGSYGVATTVGEDGAFAFDMQQRGTATLFVHLSRDGDYETTLAVAEGDANLTVNLVKGVGARRLIVRVLDPDGHPVASAEGTYCTRSCCYNLNFEHGTAEVDSIEGAGEGAEEGLLEVEFAKDEEGHLLPLGRVRMAGVKSGQALEVRLPPESAIEGRVFGPGGKAVANARVRAHALGPPGEDEQIHDDPIHWKYRAEVVTSDASGAFRIGHLGEGAHRVFVLPPVEYAPPEPMRVSAGARDVVVTLERAIAPTLRVLDPDGKPVVKARVVLARAYDDSLDEVVSDLFSQYGPGAESLTDDSGTVHFAGLSASARYVLGVRSSFARSDLAEVVETRWSPTDTTLRLSRGLAIAGVVKDREGKPISDVTVSCYREVGTQTYVKTGSDGTFRFSGLSAGAVQVDARILDAGLSLGVHQASVASEAGTEDIVVVLDRPQR